MLMPQDKVKRIHLIYGCVAAVLIVALGIALIVSCWGIYQSGPRPYTHASVGEKLQNLALLIGVSAAAILGGFILNLCLPLQKSKPKALLNELITMKKLAAKAGTPSAEQKIAIENEQRKRWFFPVITAGIFGGLSARPVFYLTDKANFPALDPNGEITAAAIVALPPAIIGLALCFLCSLLVKKCIIRETEIYKQLIASGNKVAPIPADEDRKPTLLKTVRFAIFAVALVFIVIGIFNGSADDVLKKAIVICTECIGLG